MPIKGLLSGSSIRIHDLAEFIGTSEHGQYISAVDFFAIRRVHLGLMAVTHQDYANVIINLDISDDFVDQAWSDDGKGKN